jgi:hypothetical protein
MKHLFRYLTGTIDYGITLGGNYSPHDFQLRAFADASFANDVITRYSVGGHVIFAAGEPVLWKSKKQTFVAFSTTEAEFANLTPAGQAVVWVNRILEGFGAKQPKPMVLFTDSANAAKTVLNPLKTARTRTLDIRYKWIIDRTAKGDFDIQQIPGEEMAADGLTKPLLPEKHNRFCIMMGIQAKKIPWD